MLMASKLQRGYFLSAASTNKCRNMGHKKQQVVTNGMGLQDLDAVPAWCAKA